MGELNVLTNIFIREKKEAGQSESEEAMWQWMQRPEKERDKQRQKQREGVIDWFENTTLLALKTEEGATSQGI